MSTRRASRELALQALYQLDVRDDTERQSLALFWSHFDPTGEASPFARELVAGVMDDRTRIDGLITDAAQHWKIGRLSKVDLNVLRLAAHELLSRQEIPASVTINEAIEIARRFGTPESSSFVNGVLDAIAGTLGLKGKPGNEAQPVKPTVLE